MTEVDRLGALQMRVAGHRPVGVCLREREQARHQRPRQRPRALAAPLDEQGEVGGDLVVAGAARVQLAANRADDLGQPALDRHVDVLVVGAELELARLELGRDRVEAVEQGRELRVVDDAGAVQPGYVRAGARHVLGPEPAVVAERRVQAREQRIGRSLEASHCGLTIGSAPERSCGSWSPAQPERSATRSRGSWPNAATMWSPSSATPPRTRAAATRDRAGRRRRHGPTVPPARRAASTGRSTAWASSSSGCPTRASSSASTPRAPATWSWLHARPARGGSCTRRPSTSSRPSAAARCARTASPTVRRAPPTSARSSAPRSSSSRRRIAGSRS